jgi:hypothetical protein
MDGVEVITKLQRLAKNQLENLTLSITSGNVDNMEKYQYMIGQIRVYEYLLQELSNLLSKKEHKENGGNIIKLD